eukprot:SAG31_NODE_11609_length_1013_cov_4.615974_3_plen_136_part_01
MWWSKLFFFGMLLGLLCQMVVEASTQAAQTDVPVNTADHQPSLDMSQLSHLEIDPVLMKFIGGVVTQLREENAVINAQLARVQMRTEFLETQNNAVRAELKQVQRDKEALQNKTHVAEAELSNVLIVVAQLQKQTL